MARRLIPHGPHTASFNCTSRKWFQPLYFSFQSAIILDPEKTEGRMKSRGFDCGWIDWGGITTRRPPRGRLRGSRTPPGARALPTDLGPSYRPGPFLPTLALPTDLDPSYRPPYLPNSGSWKKRANPSPLDEDEIWEGWERALFFDPTNV